MNWQKILKSWRLFYTSASIEGYLRMITGRCRNFISGIDPNFKIVVLVTLLLSVGSAFSAEVTPPQSVTLTAIVQPHPQCPDPQHLFPLQFNCHGQSFISCVKAMNNQAHWLSCRYVLMHGAIQRICY